MLSNDGSAGLTVYVVEVSDGTVLENGLTGTGTDAAVQTANVILAGRDGGGNNLDGDMAHAFTINGELTLAEIQQYRLSPAKTLADWNRKHGSTFYLPLIGLSPEPDWSGSGNNGTVNGTTVSDMPPTKTGYGGNVLVFPPAAATGANTLTANSGSYSYTGTAASLPTTSNDFDAIPNSLTEWTITGENFWQGKTHKNAWWNSYQSRWDGLIPYDEAGTLTEQGDFYIAGDITGTINWEMGSGTNKIELEDRSSGRPTIYWDDTGKKLYAASFHDTTTEYWEITYNSTTDEYAFSVGTAGSGETVTGISRDSGGALHTGSMYVVPNGDVWVGLLTNSGLELNRRSGGSWNGSTVVLDATLDNGVCSINHFENAGTTYVYIFSAEDDLVTSAEFNAYYIDEDHASPMTAGNWTEDTVSAATLIGDVADNHIDTVRDSSNNIYIVGKSGTSTTGETLIYLLDRTPGGTYTAHEVTQKQASAANDRSRPCVAWDSTNDKIVIGYSKQQTGDLISWKTEADISDLDTWSADVEIFADSGNSISNLRTPQQNFAATNETGVLFIAERVIPAGDATGEDVVYNVHNIGAIGANNLAADSGTYTYSGTAASLLADRLLSADSGAYTYAGTAAELIKGSLLAADSGSYAYTGTTADLIRGLVLDASTGAYTYTGTTVTLTFASAGDFTLTADSGAYVYSGTVAELVSSRVLTADSGAYVYTGTNAELTSGFMLQADTGTYAYTGTAVDFVQQRVLDALSGTYVYNGTAANIFFTPVPPDVPEADGLTVSGAFGNGVSFSATFGTGATVKGKL
jgi:hypothetical protein